MGEIAHRISGLIFRPAKVEDLVHFDELVAREHFDLGLHNWKLYYSLSPEDFWVLIDPENEKLVGISTGNLLRNDMLWGQQVVVDPEYRKKKLMLHMYQFTFRERYFAGNRNQKSMLALNLYPARFEHKQIGFYGMFTVRKEWLVPAPAGVKVIKLESSPLLVVPSLLNNLYKYDGDLYSKLPFVREKRRRWFSQWLFPENPDHSYSVIAYRPSDNTVCGYGVARLQTDYYAIAPVYADSEDIAYALLCFLANRFKNSEHVYLEFHANRRSCFKFVTEAHLAFTYSNFRCYNAFVPNLPIEKLYCDHEFWPL